MTLDEDVHHSKSNPDPFPSGHGRTRNGIHNLLMHGSVVKNVKSLSENQHNH